MQEECGDGSTPGTGATSPDRNLCARSCADTAEQPEHGARVPTRAGGGRAPGGRSEGIPVSLMDHAAADEEPARWAAANMLLAAGKLPTVGVTKRYVASAPVR